LDEIAPHPPRRTAPQDVSRFSRPSGLDGVEALHATFRTHRYQPHIHDAWTIASVQSGAAAFTLYGRTYIASQGSSFFIPPYVVHTGESAIPNGYQYQVLYLSPEAIAEQSPDAAPLGQGRLPVVVVDAGISGRLRRLHRRLVQPKHALEQSEALVHVTTALAQLASDTHLGPSVANRPSVGQAVEFIHTRWRDDFTLAELATAVGLSQFHLIRIFRRDMGVAPSATVERSVSSPPSDCCETTSPYRRSRPSAASTTKRI
jgi:AraC-like DNA-binding protein